MRSIERDDNSREVSNLELAGIAEAHAKAGMDSYADYGVGASILVEITIPNGGYQNAPSQMYQTGNTQQEIYAGFNINLSGMEVKIHAEQLALFQIALDWHDTLMWDNLSIKKVMVVTTGDDMSLVCGHCLQVVRGFCKELRQVGDDVWYIAADRRSDDEGDWKFNPNMRGELLGESYIEQDR